VKAKAYSYLRFSTRDQIHGDSLRRQTEAAADWCRKNGVNFVESYRDLGVSAFKGKNAATGALASFLALVKKGQIPKGSYLIVESLDRISRNSIMDALELFMSIIRAGVILVTLTDNHVYDAEKINGGNFTDLIISLTVLSRANEESKTKALRISASWDAKRRNIKEQKLTGKCVGWLRLAADKKRFEIIPDRVAIVRRIFDMVIGGQGANGIAKALNREKVPTFGRSKAWHVSYIKKILDNRAAIGEYTPALKRDGKRTFLDAIPNYYPAIIPREKFATAQQLRKARPSFKGRGSFNVFSKLCFDRATGTAMTYVNKNRQKGWHYLVPYAAIRQQADYSAWQYDEFLSYFLTVCKNAALQKLPDVEADHGKLAVAQMELDEANKQIKRLVEFLASGASGAVEAKLRETEQRQKELQARIHDLENEAAAKPTDMGKVNWRDSGRLRENLRATVKRITVDAAAKSFHAEFLDGRIYDFETDGETVTIKTPDKMEDK
jgi:DNA invertase Pin-like site-specific DNA recombinase/cell division protein FtsB